MRPRIRKLSEKFYGVLFKVIKGVGEIFFFEVDALCFGRRKNKACLREPFF